MMRPVLVAVAWILFHNHRQVNGFAVSTKNAAVQRRKMESPQPSWQVRTSRTMVVVSAKRRGKLGSLVEDGIIDTKSLRSTKPSKSKLSKKDTASQVSPDLASFMASKMDPQPESSSAATSSSTQSEPTFEDSSEDKKSRSSRRTRSTERMRMDEEASKEAKLIVTELQEAIAKGKDVIPAVDSAVDKLSKVNKLKQLAKSPAALDYRLAWVASDAAVSAVGSALHRKVALARLQEVFLTLHRNRLQMLEVIRILGPFPNVKNTLSGAAKFSRKDTSEWTITWQSLIDGTGKENFEGGETKSVTLDILHGDETVIVAKVVDENVPDDQCRLVFIRDEDMDATLESLRVL